MNTQNNNQFELRANALGRAVARRLSEGAEDLPRDISERLKVARTQAVAKRKIVSTQTATAGAVSMSGGEAVVRFGGQDGGWFNRLASLVPLLALVAGLVSIAVLQDDSRVQELAEVDAELLTDDLPPAAYLDPGFANYLRINQATR